MTNEAISRSNCCEGVPSTSPKEAERRVSFSSKISIVSDNGDAIESPVRSEWLSDPPTIIDLSPRSLISGRWAEINTTESKNSREVSVIELTDHSPGPYCPARKRLNFAESDGSCSNDTKSPIKKNNGNHSIPSLTKSESVLPLFVENNMDGNGRSNGSPTNYSPNKVPMSQLMIIQTCDLSPLIGPPEDVVELTTGPISRRGKIWTRIVNILRAVIVCMGYAVAVGGKLLCGENVKKFVLAKLVGVFVLCCLASLPTREKRRRRTGWMSLTEIICSRKTFLLLIYTVAWNCIVDSTSNLWTGHPVASVSENCTKGRNDWPGPPWKSHEYEESPRKPATFLNLHSGRNIVDRDNEMNEGDVDFDVNAPSNQEIKIHAPPVTDDRRELLIDAEGDEDVYDPHVCAFQTHLVLQPRTVDVATVETNIFQVERDYRKDIDGVNIDNGNVQVDVNLQGTTAELGQHLTVPQTVDSRTASKRDTAHTEGFIKESRYHYVLPELRRNLGSKVLRTNIHHEPEDDEVSLPKDDPSKDSLASKAQLKPEQQAESMKPISYTTNGVAVMGSVDEYAIVSDIWQRSDNDSITDSVTPETLPALEPLLPPRLVEEMEESLTESTVVKTLVQEDSATVYEENDNDNILLDNKLAVTDPKEEGPQIERVVLNAVQGVDTPSAKLLEENVIQTFFGITDERATESNVISSTAKLQTFYQNHSAVSNEDLQGLFFTEARFVSKTPYIRILEDGSQGMLSLKLTSHRFGMKPLDMESPAFLRVLLPETPDRQLNYFDSRDLKQVFDFAKAAWRHSIAFLIGVNGRYKNEQMMEVLSIVWTNRFWQ
mmetsp:Transcript_5554/g.10156  ORF Transcript_5554/g.10156 Transcript_5554/m.10156 type:complete len:829 (-) Transcript_5554:306-2792(-)